MEDNAGLGLGRTNIGTSGEYQAASLFWMHRSDRNAIRPDLLSLPGTYHKGLVIEVKTGVPKSPGARASGTMSGYQFTYEGTLETDFAYAFGATGVPEEITYYYDALERTDMLRANQLNSLEETLRTTFGDHHLVPEEFALITFAIAQARKFKERPPQALKRLRREITSAHGDPEHPLHYTNRQGYWQNLHIVDILKLHAGDLSTNGNQQAAYRMQWIQDLYPVSSLQPITIPGPNGTHIYVLAKPEDTELFDKDMRAIVKKRKKILESVAPLRKRAAARCMHTLRDPRAIERRRKLIRWLHPNEEEPDFIPF